MDEQKMVDLTIDVAPEGVTTLEIQKSLQEALAGRFPDDVSAGAAGIDKMSRIVRNNVLAIMMECAELLDRFDWKYWKPGKLAEMSPDDLAELLIESQFEAVDIQHFLNNIYILLGMDDQRVRNIYYTKNKENLDRQRRWFGG